MFASVRELVRQLRRPLRRTAKLSCPVSMHLEQLEHRELLSNLPWTQRGGDSGHTGYVDVTVNTKELSTVWEHTIQSDSAVGSWYQKAPAIDEHRIYRTESFVGGGFSNLFVMAFDRQKGNELWRTEIQGGAHDGVGAPSVVDGVVYVNRSGHSGSGSISPTLFALNAETGVIIDQQPFSAQWATSERPAVGSGHVIFEDGYYGGISSFSTSTLDQFWSGSGTEWKEPMAAIDDEYAYAWGTTVYRLSDAARSVLPKPAGYLEGGKAMVSQTGRVIVSLSGTAGSAIAAYDGNSHVQLWVRPLSNAVTVMAVGQGQIAVLTGSQISLIDEATGIVVRSWSNSSSASDGYYSEMILTRNVLFVQRMINGPYGNVEVVGWSLATGTKIWSLATTSTSIEMAMAGDDLVLSGLGSLTLVSPTRTQHPLTWESSAGAIGYDIWFSQIAPVTQRLHFEQNLTSSSYTIPQELEPGIYRYWTRPVNAFGVRGSWSTLEQFEIRPTVIGPSGSSFERRPEFTWNEVKGAASYQVFLRTSSGDIIQSGITSTSWTPTQDLPREKIKWWVRYAGAIGNQGWSLPATIDLTGRTEFLPGTAQQPTAFRTLEWYNVTGASRYILHVIDDTQNVVIRLEGLTATSFTPTNAFPAGRYRAWLKAIDSTNSFASGIWSSMLDFTV